MPDVQEPRDMYDASVPTLTDVVATGDPTRVRSAPPMSLSLGETPAAAGAATPAVFAGSGGGSGAAGYDADALVERLRGRCLTWLSGDGRTMVETRCRAALQEHSNWLVGQITREVGLALETELAGWVREALRDEAASRSGGGV